LARGVVALSDVALLPILGRTDIEGKGVLQMARKLLQLKNDSGLCTPGGCFDGI